ncbi:MAG TPA: ferredoxin--NADP reductase [Polyangiaceae bacterium]|jgi:3-ketosteroid 9alpha-monooxygenase subunit B
MFHPVRVARLVQETADATSIVLEVPAALEDAFRYRAGQFVTLEVEVGGERLRRSYSLASSPDCEREHKVTVKRVEGGRVSSRLHASLCEGDLLSVTRPEGRFVLDASADPLVLFAGGSGITPVVSLLKTALCTTERTVTLLYANRDERSIIFRAELEELARRHAGRLRVVHRLDTVHGVIREADVRGIVAEAPRASFYLCGPAPFMTLVEQTLLASGVPDERVRIERFLSPRDASNAASAAPSSESETPATVDVVLGGERHTVPYTPGRTLLQAARDAGLDAPYSCEEGFCGCCASDLLEGRVVMAADDALGDAEKKKGMILACQSRPVTARCAFRFVDG